MLHLGLNQSGAVPWAPLSTGPRCLEWVPGPAWSPPGLGTFSRLAIDHCAGYIGPVPRKPIELPPAVARRFVQDMRAFHAEKNSIKRDEVAARQMHALRQLQGPRDKKLRVADVIEMFRQMRDQV